MRMLICRLFAEEDVVRAEQEDGVEEPPPEAGPGDAFVQAACQVFVHLMRMKLPISII